MNVICTKSVIMEDSKEHVFTEGKTYKIYSSTYEDGYDIYPCIKAKNDRRNRHVILTKDLKAEDFFEKHFKLTV